MKEKEEILRCIEELIIRLEPDWLITEEYEHHIKEKKHTESLKAKQRFENN